MLVTSGALIGDRPPGFSTEKTTVDHTDPLFQPLPTKKKMDAEEIYCSHHSEEVILLNPRSY